jgi:exonuclease VII large subunit
MAEPHRRHLTDQARRLQIGLPQRLTAARHKLDALARHLEAVGPMNVLRRGYSYTLGPDGQVLRRVAAVEAGQRITTVLADGQLASRIEGESEAAGKPGVVPRRRRLRKSSDTAQDGLFG